MVLASVGLNCGVYNEDKTQFIVCLYSKYVLSHWLEVFDMQVINDTGLNLENFYRMLYNIKYYREQLFWSGTRIQESKSIFISTSSLFELFGNPF